MDLPHPVRRTGPARGPTADWKAHVGPAVNADFRQKWVELLRQVWLGFENREHSGRQPHRPELHRAAVPDAQDMMGIRRRGGR